jgi:hypothetical protein
MRRRKRFTLRLVALGFAAAALGAPAAKAMPDGLTGPEIRVLQQAQQRADQRGVHQLVFTQASKRRAQRAR